jgi:uncharacterized protein
MLMRSRFSITTLAVVATFWLAVAMLTSARAASASAPPAARPIGSTNPFREIKWDELMPKGWDPTESFRKRSAGIVSDADPRAWKLMKEFRVVLDHAPTVDTLNGVAVKVPGYVVPLETVRGELKEFLLVPYFGACIHTPAPPANQVIFVRPGKPAAFRSMDTVWVSGTLHTTRQESFAGASGYTIDAVAIEPYVGTPHP